MVVFINAESWHRRVVDNLPQTFNPNDVTPPIPKGQEAISQFVTSNNIMAARDVSVLPNDGIERSIPQYEFFIYRKLLSQLHAATGATMVMTVVYYVSPILKKL